MTPIRIVGIMLTKDEADAVSDVIPPLVGALDALYYFAGDAATGDAIDVPPARQYVPSPTSFFFP